MVISEKMIWGLVPLVLLQLTLIVICFLDWRKRSAFNYIPKYGWLFIFILINYIGPILYLTIGKGHDSDQM